MKKSAQSFHILEFNHPSLRVGRDAIKHCLFFPSFPIVYNSDRLPQQL
jgi:hypothetical protein